MQELTAKVQKEKDKTSNADFFAQAASILNNYKTTENIIEKNFLLKTILDKAVYHKSKDISGDNFELLIYLKFPDT
jgi:hypothetical protein